LLSLAELGAGLDRELVAGEVAETERGERVGLCARIVGRLVGEAEDEIGRNARDARRERAFDRAARAVWIVEAAEEAELFGAKRLRADRESRHTSFEQRGRAVAIERGRIALGCDLDVAREREELCEPRENAAELSRIPEARRSSAEE